MMFYRPPHNKLEAWLFYDRYRYSRELVAKYLGLSNAKFEKAMEYPEKYLTTVHFQRIATLVNRPAEQVYLACKHNYLKYEDDYSISSIKYMNYIERVLNDDSD